MTRHPSAAALPRPAGHPLCPGRRGLVRRVALGVAVALGLAGAAPAAPPSAADASRRLHAMFDADWRWRMQAYPEWATYDGDDCCNDRLTDNSPAARAARLAYTRGYIQRLESVDRRRLARADRVSLDVALHEARNQAEAAAHPGLERMAITTQGGLHTDFAELLRISPMRHAQDAQHVLARMAMFPSRVDQTIALMREGLATGWVTFRPSMERVLQQIDGQLPADLRASPLYEPFTRLPPDMPDADREALRQRGLSSLQTLVVPALQRLRAFIAEDYLPQAPARGALGNYPDGAAAYGFLVRLNASTTLSPAQIHDIGLRETARLRGDMEALMRSTGHPGPFADFTAWLNSDPRFFHATPEAMLAAYRDIAKRVEPELPRLFAELPRTPYGIRAMPAHLGAGQSEYYDGPAADGSRAGWFNANVLALRQRPVWEMETLFLHEAVPGHHLQTARALELTDLPRFRRDLWEVAYGEGWALYAETLGFELGLYTDPYQRFGHLQAQAWRAARLAVDTGIHALGWSREQAIDWMSERTGVARAAVEPEVDRYIVDPAQALGYYIGQMKIIELRDRAKGALGERFDLRQFHMAVLDNGPLPLAVLERQIDDWIAARKAVPGARPKPATKAPTQAGR